MKTKKCINCEKLIPVDARLCPYCGEILTVDDPTAQPKEQASPKKDRKGFAIASVVLGLSFIVFACLYSLLHKVSPDLGGVIGILAIFSPVLSLPGIIFGIIGLRSKLRKLAIAGIVINSLVFFLLSVFGCVIVFLSANWRG